MKKKIIKKLTLNKETLLELNKKEMKSINGGNVPPVVTPHAQTVGRPPEN